MPIKVSDFLTHVNSYPVVRVEDNVILGYAYSNSFDNTGLLAVPPNNRRAGLLLANRALYAYDLANTGDANWGDTTKFKEIAVRFSSYPVLPTVGDQTVGDFLTAEPDDNIFFAVYRDSTNLFHKVASNNIIEWLVASLVDAEVSAGNGTTQNFTGSTGLVGDLNNDGVVTSADLLIFLQNYGSSNASGDGTYIPSKFILTGSNAINLLNASGWGDNYTIGSKKYFQFGAGYSADANTFDVTIVTIGTHYVAFKDSTNYSIAQFSQDFNLKFNGGGILADVSIQHTQVTLFGVTLSKYNDNTLVGTPVDVDLTSHIFGQITTNYSWVLPTSININTALNNIPDPFGAGNGSLNVIGYDEVRVSFYMRHDVGNVALQSLILSGTLVASPNQ